MEKYSAILEMHRGNRGDGQKIQCRRVEKISLKKNDKNTERVSLGIFLRL